MTINCKEMYLNVFDLNTNQSYVAFKKKLSNFLVMSRETSNVQGGHKPGKHGKPGKLREFENLSKTQGK